MSETEQEGEECCDDWDELSSHYHCVNCGERCSMMGHWSNDEFICVAREE